MRWRNTYSPIHITRCQLWYEALPIIDNLSQDGNLNSYNFGGCQDGGLPFRIISKGKNQSGMDSVGTSTPFGNTLGKRYVGSRKRRLLIEGGRLPSTSQKSYSFANSATTNTYLAGTADIWERSNEHNSHMSPS